MLSPDRIDRTLKGILVGSIKGSLEWEGPTAEPKLRVSRYQPRELQYLSTGSLSPKPLNPQGFRV